MSDDYSGADLSRRQMIVAGTTGLVRDPAGPSRAAARGVPSPPTARQSRSTSLGATIRLPPWWCRGRRRARRCGPGCASASVSSPPRNALIPTAERHHRADVPRAGGQAAPRRHLRLRGHRRQRIEWRRPVQRHVQHGPRGPARFGFTSFGDLATPNPAWASSYGQAAYAVGAVETFQPLFHLINGDLAYADLILGRSRKSGATSATTCRPRRRTDRGCRCRVITSSSWATAPTASPPT